MLRLLEILLLRSSIDGNLIDTHCARWQESVLFCLPSPDRDPAGQAGLHLPRLQPGLPQDLPRQSGQRLLKLNNQLDGTVSSFRCVLAYSSFK